MKFEDKYRALLDRDQTFEGSFIVAVKTTGVFCRPTCRARKPLKKNVVFYKDVQEALLHGYRPCKICQPMKTSGHTPVQIKTILNQLQADPVKKITDFELRNMGINPATVRRWFQSNYQMTFHTYQRLLKLNKAFGSIHLGDSVTQAAFKNGFESLSSFQNTFKQVFGIPPSKSKSAQVITYNRVNTQLGPMLAGVTEDGLCLLEFTDRRMLPTQIQRVQKYLNATALPGEHPLLHQLQFELDQYFRGARKTFTIPLLTPGTAFQQRVWDALLEIPFAETRSYQQQAELLDKPEAIRAVARANGDNRISIIIPCHRVLGKDGSLTGYGGGLWRKQWLLDHELDHK